eukprot:TRINITY_DN4855_c0_g1_i1.p1 TRINITY_DN4855_c0_g1~~TRINITY_DN4855_c0_g1_i1.p1  ORF type:complete len:383 (-),score=84.80 TRINITY_DN4855_c0_g1_i1:261-1409(-)
MESNRDEAERCFILAQESENSGDFEKAIRLYKKASRLFGPLATEAESHISRLERRSESSRSSTRQQNARQPAAPVEPDSTTEVKYTTEQVQEITRIRKCKDYYEILDVRRDSTEIEIKKQYKKLALQMHPDKNQAPGAEDAFKKVGQAFSCLSDAEKRRMYDLRGTEEPEQVRSSRGGQRAAWEGEISPEELFSMFFGGMPMHRGGSRFRGSNGGVHFSTYPNFAAAQRRQQRQAAETDTGLSWLQFLPLLLLLVFSFLTSFAGSRPALFELNKTSTHTQKRTIKAYDVSYYVEPSFAQTHDIKSKSFMEELETQVLQKWLQREHQQCQAEQAERNSKLRSARFYFGEYGEKLRAEAQNMPTPHCDKFQSIKEQLSQRGWML